MPGRRNRSRPKRGRRNARPSNIFSPRFDAKMTSCPIRLCQTGTLSSNGAGTLASLIYNDPYSASFTEYTSDFANIYNQFRLLGTRVQFCSLIETKGDTTVLAIGYQNRNTGLGTPTSVNAVADNQPSTLWPVSNDTSNRGRTMKQSMNHLLFAATSTSSNTSTDSAGAPGGWQVYGAGLPASTNIVYYLQEVFLQFRSRS